MESILQKERSLTDLERETFFRRLGLLLQGGLPILRALGALEGHSGPAVKKLCRSLARSLGRGFSLSQALRQQERQAGNLAAPLAAAGEASG
ncbi:type II secretion system F family protein, partial [Acidaminococcus fermentans]